MKINSLQIEIDGIDKEILRDLMEDARKPILQIANKIGISGAAIHQRLRKLEQAGVISGSKFIVNTKVLGYSTMAFVGVYLDKAARNSEAVRELKKIPEVLECHYTTGNWSILIKIICRDNEHLMQLLNSKIQAKGFPEQKLLFLWISKSIGKYNYKHGLHGLARIKKACQFVLKNHPTLRAPLQRRGIKKTIHRSEWFLYKI